MAQSVLLYSTKFVSTFPGPLFLGHAVYKSLIQPHFDYCNVVWFGRFNADVRKGSALQKDVQGLSYLLTHSLTLSSVMFSESLCQIVGDTLLHF